MRSCLSPVAAFCGVLFIATICAAADSQVQAKIDLTSPTVAFPHFWETCVGSGHALLALRADWQRQMTLAQSELGFQYVRFHGWLDDDMSAVLPDGSFSFFNIDAIIDFLLSINMRPIMELSFMPTLFASGNATIFHYQGNITPPSDYSKWASFISALIAHLEGRYGPEEVRRWHFEVWNEPNCGFWTGSFEDYLTLYNYTSLAIHSVDSQLSVGGPATCQTGLLEQFISYVQANSLPVNFVSTHLYPTDPGVAPNYTGFGVNVTTAVQTAQAAGLPLFLTEYNCGLAGAATSTDTNYAAAFVMRNVPTLAQLNINVPSPTLPVFSYWTFSDIFEEGGFIPNEFAEKFGMMTVNGVRKPVWQAFRLLHQLGDQWLNVVQTPSSLDSPVLVFAAAGNSDQDITIVASNFNTPPQTLVNATVQIQISFSGSLPPSAKLFRIDSDNTNPQAVYQQQGSPVYPSPGQLHALMQASELIASSVPIVPVSSGVASIELPLPALGVAVISFSTSQ